MGIEGFLVGEDPLLVGATLHLALYGDLDTLHLHFGGAHGGVRQTVTRLYPLVGHSQHQLRVRLTMNVPTLQQVQTVQNDYFLALITCIYIYLLVEMSKLYILVYQNSAIGVLLEYINYILKYPQIGNWKVDTVI